MRFDCHVAVRASPLPWRRTRRATGARDSEHGVGGIGEGHGVTCETLVQAQIDRLPHVHVEIKIGIVDMIEHIDVERRGVKACDISTRLPLCCASSNRREEANALSATIRMAAPAAIPGVIGQSNKVIPGRTIFMAVPSLLLQPHCIPGQTACRAARLTAARDGSFFSVVARPVLFKDGPQNQAVGEQADQVVIRGILAHDIAQA